MEKGLLDNHLCTGHPVNPVAGDLYIFDLSAFKSSKDIRVDKYVWHNDGRKKYPKSKNSVFFKTIFKIVAKDKTYSDKFRKHLFEHIENKNFVVVHYLGDETVFTPVCHGNAKDPSKVFRRTCPSVFEEIRCKSKEVTKTATEVERESKSKAEYGSDLGVKTAKNVEQVKNHFYKARQKN